MATSASGVVPAHTDTARAGLGERLTTLWERRPDWLRDNAVLGLAASLLVLLALFVAALSYVSADRPGTHLTLDRLEHLLLADDVATLELRDQDAVAVGTLRADNKQFSTAYPSSDAVTAQIIKDGSDHGTRVSVDEQTMKQSVRAVATFLLPLMILANLFALLFVGSRAGGSALRDVETFGTVGKGRRTGAADSRVTFADVAAAAQGAAAAGEGGVQLRRPARPAARGA